MTANTAKQYQIEKEPYYCPVANEVDLYTAAYGVRMPVMLKGPTGCGKSRFVEAMAARLGRELVTVACNDETSAADLLGRWLVRGGDTVWQDGPVTRAVREGAILYLDEVADMPIGTQSKILRVLTEQTFTRVDGADRVKVDLRVISSTTRDLRAEIGAGTFRQELYDRLNVVPIAVPSLSERREDIPVLARHFIELLAQTQGLPKRDLSEEAETQLQSMNWPGNIRQLRNVIERALILGDSQGAIEARDLIAEAAGGEEEGRVVLAGGLATLPLREARELFEREYLLTQINRFGGNISRTAAFVGMERSALHRKLKSLGVNTAALSGGRSGRDD